MDLGQALTTNIDTGQIALAAAAGGVAGLTLGIGTGLVAEAFTTGSAVAATTGTALIGAGSGIAMGEVTTALDSIATGQRVDSTDLTINTVVGGTVGALQAIIPGSGAVAVGARIGLGMLAAGSGSEASDILHGNPVNVGKALKTAGVAGAIGAGIETFSARFLPPVEPITPRPYSSLGFQLSRWASRAIPRNILGNFAYQLPLNFLGDQVVIHSQ